MNRKTLSYSFGAVVGAIAGGALVAIKVLLLSTVIAAAGVIVGFISVGTAQAIVLWCVAIGALLGFVGGLLNAYLLAQAHKWVFQD